jgi:hypothetical protein
LGGALATLAAYDISKQLQDAQQDTAEVICYSFGAPRTGNHAFADDYNCMVPDTWSIINDQASCFNLQKVLKMMIYTSIGKCLLFAQVAQLKRPTGLQYVADCLL